MRQVFVLLVLVTLAAVPAAEAQVCDLAELATISVPGTPSQPAIGGTIAYLASGSSGIVPIDISDPTQPVVLTAQPTQGQAFDVTLDYFASLIAVADGSAGFSVYSIDGSATLVHQGSFNLGQNATTVTGNSGRYLVGGEGGTLFTISLGSNSYPAVDGSIQLGSPVAAVVQHNQRAYCALGSGGLATIDISDRAHPTLIGTALDLGGDVLSLTRDGTMLYAGVDGVGLVSLHIEGDQVVPLASLAVSEAPTRIIAWLSRVYMVAPGAGLMLADASLGTDLLLLDELPLDGASGLALVGSFLSIGRGSNGFSTIDLSDCAAQAIQTTTSFIGAAARATGLENTFWVTDLAIANLTPRVASVNLAYLVKDEANGTPLNSAFSLQPGQQMMLPDVLNSVFGLDSANGALRVTTSHPDVRISSRTYNAAGKDGTYGQFIPALTRADALSAGEEGVLLQLQENAGFRSNLGLVNVSGDTVEVQVDLYRGSGSHVAVWTKSLRPFEMVQATRIFNTVGAGTVDNGFAVVKVTSSDGEVLAFASVVDNGTGDPIYQPAQRLSLSF